MKMGDDYPEIFMILGNDDPRYLEESCLLLDKKGLWHYAHNRCLSWKNHQVCGYSYVPPTPFQMKDWEKYDVSRYVDVGAISPLAGFRTVEVDMLEREWGTIKRDLERLFTAADLAHHICLFHSPPYKTKLDRAALDGKMFDHAPLDVHIGSIAIREFISKRQPLTTIHGHVHESTSITGFWQETMGKTVMFNAAHNKSELAIIRFNSEIPAKCERNIR
jgi:Icc-related predicted phosphoesterase